MEQPIKQTVKQKSSALPVFIAVVITLAVVGGIAYEAYQQKSTEFKQTESDLRKEVSDLRNRADSLDLEKTTAISQFDELKKQLVDLTAKLTASTTASSTASTTAAAETATSSKK